nr:hypothetical protein [Kibdelosporangium sp. MJ126-NF4]
MVRNGPHSCAAVVTVDDAANGVTMDKYLRIHLHARVGDEVEISPVTPREASAGIQGPVGPARSARHLFFFCAKKRRSSPDGRPPRGEPTRGLSTRLAVLT